MSANQDVDGIAIIGMAGRFPGAPDVEAFWSNLCDGIESLRAFSDDEIRAAGMDPREPGFVNAGGTIDGIEEFDAGFFGMSRREAELTDPQHRIVLETAWATLEDAGYDPGNGSDRIGIFGGVATNMYFRQNLLAHPDLLERVGDYPVLLATEREYAITRAAYKLGLEGPALSVNTACSTSAVAVHLAVQSLIAGESDIALAGGAHIRLPATTGYLYQEGGILSADGRVRAFDAGARGTVMTSGVAFVALKRLADALEDADTVYAVVRGSAINNDGAARIGFTAPSIKGQASVIAEALAVAQVDADSIGMLEAHGTGTSLGDPIEVEALTRAYRRDTSRRGYCALGSLKSNVGHLDAAAGVAGIIKAALSLYHERIPPSINYSSPNPQIDFEASPFFVNTELRDWRRSDVPRRAGISSFGFGGTNAHVVLEEAPRWMALPPAAPGPRLLVLSAKTPEALQARRHALAEHLSGHPEIDLGDAAYTLAVGRAPMSHRSAIVADDTAAAIELLRRDDGPVPADAANDQGEVAFLFTGQGAQYAGMGADLYRSEPVFAAAIRECAAIVGDIEGSDLLDLLTSEAADAAIHERLLRTAVGQPAIFTIQYALARLWASWGVEPTAMVGHSVGELAAACLGGVFSLEDALRLAVERGQLMQALPVGAMTAVLAEEAVVLPLLDADTSLAAVNAPEQCVASGPPASIDELERELQLGGIPFRRLPTERAFHSPMMDAVVTPLRDLVARTAHGDLRIPMVSTVTGSWASSAEVSDPAYWASHARRTVRFAAAVGVLLAERPGMILIEVGPGATLTSLVQQQPGWSPGSVVVSSLPHRGDGERDGFHIRQSVAHAWVAGAGVDLVAVQGGRRRRIPLPTYPFARERHWIEGTAGVARLAPSIDPQRPTSSGPATTTLAPTEVLQPEAPTPAGDRSDRIAARVTSILTDLSGLDASALDPAATFTELGFDSLFMTQANSQFRKQIGVRVTLGQLLTEMSTVEKLTAYIDAELPAGAFPAVTPSADRGPDQAVGRDHAQVEGELTVVMSHEDGDRGPTRMARWLLRGQLVPAPSPAGTSPATEEPAPAAGATPALGVSPDEPLRGGPSTPVPVLPNVVRYLGERDTPHPEHWNLGVLLIPERRLDPEITRRVMTGLVQRRDALRLRFHPDGPDWTATIAPAADPPSFATSDLTGLTPSEQVAAIEHRGAHVQESLDLERGPLIHMELFDLGMHGQRLLVVAHHFVMDQMSWPPFWEDFEALYAALERGSGSVPPPSATSFEDWARALQRRADSAELRARMDAWLDLPWERIRPIPVDHPGGLNTNASADHVQVVLSSEETEALFRRTRGVARKSDLIVEALARVVATWTAADSVLIDMMGHGRDDGIADDIDPLESVGFFVSYTPLVLRIPGSGPGPRPASLCEQIESLMGQGLSHDLLRYMCRDTIVQQAFRDLPRAQILFNHHGQRDEPDEVPRGSLFAAAAESIGPTHCPEGIRYYPIAVSSEISHGRLYLNFVYSTNLHQRSTIMTLSQEFRRELAASVVRSTT